MGVGGLRNPPLGSGVLTDDRPALPHGGVLRHLSGITQCSKRHKRATPRHVPRSAGGVMRSLVSGVLEVTLCNGQIPER